MHEVTNRTKVLHGWTSQVVPVAQLLEENVPVVLKQLVRRWPVVNAALAADWDAIDYIKRFCNEKLVSVAVGDPRIDGRFFYSDQMTSLNFENVHVRLEDVLRRITTQREDPEAPAIYVASALVDLFLPGFRAENDLDLQRGGILAPPSIWIGNRTIASCHFDVPNNIACCIAGRRRFTIFPPEQVANLYPGPFDPTPGGQVVSVVDFAAPDFARFPRFRDAIAAGQIAELGPGDALFIPSMWWHHVEALSNFNALVNYWWSSTERFIPAPIGALYHAIWTVRDRPAEEKQAWKDLFDYYVFERPTLAGEHLPAAARGCLGPINESAARLLRAKLLRGLNR